MPPSPLFLSPSGITCQPVVRNPLSTMDTTFTTAAQRVLDLNAPDAILHIRRGDNMWRHMEDYVDIKLQSSQNAVTTSQCHRVAQNKRSIDPLSHQRAAALLHAQEAVVLGRYPVPITSTASARDEGEIQIMSILKAAIQTRYPNRAQPAIYPYTESSGADVSQHVYYPNWIATCPALHKEAGLGPDNAGYSDFILSMFPDRAANTAVAEFKPFWSYSSQSLLEHYYGDPSLILKFNTDEFQWSSPKNAPRELLKQIYGELHYMGAQVAFFSNLEVVFVAVLTEDSGTGELDASGGSKPVTRSEKKPEKKHPVMVLSTPRRWTDPNLHAALTGLSFMAIDAADWMPKKSMMELLCPVGPGSCVPLTTPLDAETQAILQEYGL